jgi:hypothetical protein
MPLDDATNNYFPADDYSTAYRAVISLNVAATIADADALDPADDAHSNPRERDQVFARQVLAYARRRAQDMTFTPYVRSVRAAPPEADETVYAVSLAPGRIGDVVENLGRKLRALPFFESPRAWERRRDVDTFAAFCEAKDCAWAVYSAGFRLQIDPVSQEDFLNEYNRLSAERTKIVDEAIKRGLAIDFIKIEAPPRFGGAMLDPHGHFDLCGPHLAAMAFRNWLCAKYPTGWMGKRARNPARLAGYLSKGPCTVDPGSPDQWEPQWAYRFAKLLEGHSLRWTTYYGEFKTYRHDHRDQHPRYDAATGWQWHDAAPRPERKRLAPRDGEVIIRVGTIRKYGVMHPVIYVRGYKYNIINLMAKYDLTAALSWAASYVGKSISTAFLNTASYNAFTQSIQPDNSQQTWGYVPDDPDDAPVPF